MNRLTPDQNHAILSGLAVLKPKAIYLFGSFGTDRQHPESDLDLAVLPSADLDPVALFELSNRLSDELGFSVDLVDLAKASTVMAKEVLRTGTRLKADDLKACQQFEMRTLSDYARLNEERACILER